MGMTFSGEAQKLINALNRKMKVKTEGRLLTGVRLYEDEGIAKVKLTFADGTTQTFDQDDPDLLNKQFQLGQKPNINLGDE